MKFGQINQSLVPLGLPSCFSLPLLVNNLDAAYSLLLHELLKAFPLHDVPHLEVDLLLLVLINFFTIKRENCDELEPGKETLVVDSVVTSLIEVVGVGVEELDGHLLLVVHLAKEGPSV